MSEELLSRRMGVQGRRVRRRWWKYSNDSKNAPTFPRTSHTMDPPDGHYERAIIKVGETMLLKKQQEMVLLTKADRSRLVADERDNVYE